MLKVQLSLLAVALMLVCTATESPSWPLLTNPNISVRACGKRLTQLLQLICGGKYNPLYTKKSLQDADVDASYWDETPRPLGEDLVVPMLARESAAALVQGTFRRQNRGVIDECCKKSCFVRTLSAYCAPTE